MSSVVVRTLTLANYVKPPAGAGRKVARLSTGGYVTVMRDMNGSVPTLYLYYSANGVAWTLKNSWAIGTASSSVTYAFDVSIAVDDSNNLHIVYTPYSVGCPGASYIKMTYSASGPTWTAGTIIGLLTPNVAYSACWVDIDFAGNGSTGKPIVGVSYYNINTGTTVYDYMLINGATVTILSTNAYASNAGDYRVAVAARHTTESDGSLVFSYLSLFGSTWSWAIARVSSAGSVTFMAQTPITPTYVFSTSCRTFTSGDREFTGFFYGGGSPLVYRVTWDASYNVTFTYLGTQGSAPIDIALISRDVYVYFYGAYAAPKLIAGFVSTANNSLTLLSATGFPFDNFASYPSMILSNLYAGFNRNIDFGFYDPALMMGAILSGGAYSVSAVPLRIPPAVSSVTPVNGATITSDLPAVGGNVGIDSGGDQSDYKITWQFARDTGFTTNLITQDSNTYKNGGSSFGQVLALVNKLTSQGIWYLRARVTNRFNVVSAWSSINTITDSHTPVATPLSPLGGAAVAYGAGNIAFSWSFSDTSPTASQTAYRIQVIDTTTGSTVLDTGKVASTGTVAVLNIGLAYKDKLLNWKVSLWDNDDFQGSYTTPQTFYVTDAPTPAITSPADGSTLATGLVTVVWDSGLPGTKTQAKYHVVVTQGVTVVYDSGTVTSAATSLDLPVGTVHNDLSYSVQLTVTDNLNVTGQSFIGFSVQFVGPSRPGNLQIYDYPFNEQGFVWIGWDNLQKDPDFIEWKLYRKEQGDADWTLVSEFTLDRSSYGYNDTVLKSNTKYEYCVTQVVNRSGVGDILESDIVAMASVSPAGEKYWLIDTDELEAPVPLYSATADTLTDEYERSSYTVIGRGRHEDIGEHLGINGSLTVQVRDHWIGGGYTTNILSDPSFQDGLPFSTQWDYSATAGVSFSSQTYLEAPPSGVIETLFVSCEAGSTVGFMQTPTVVPFVSVGDQFNASVYVAESTGDISKLGVQVTVTYYDEDGTDLGNTVQDLAVVENWNNNDHWYRFAVVMVASHAADYITVEYDVIDTSGSDIIFTITGAQITPGVLLATYFDGSRHGATWDELPYSSSSSTKGYYTARDQRLDIASLAALNRPLYLRTPFGDIWQISLGDNALDRLAGTGSESEYGDLTLPYLEVAL